MIDIIRMILECLWNFLTQFSSYSLDNTEKYFMKDWCNSIVKVLVIKHVCNKPTNHVCQACTTHENCQAILCSPLASPQQIHFYCLVSFAATIIPKDILWWPSGLTNTTRTSLLCCLPNSWLIIFVASIILNLSMFPLSPLLVVLTCSISTILEIHCQKLSKGQCSLWDCIWVAFPFKNVYFQILVGVLV